MKWIVLSDSDPHDLHEHLCSGEEFMRNIEPCVLYIWDDDSKDLALSQILHGLHEVLGIKRDAFHLGMMSVLDEDTKQYPIEQMTLITLDTQQFIGRPNLNVAWQALQDPNTLGFRLSVDLGRLPGFTCPHMQKNNKGRMDEWLTWLYAKQSDHWGDVFSYGTVYRTSDLVTALSRTEWQDAASLVSAAGRDPALTRRTKMACFAEPSIKENG